MDSIALESRFRVLRQLGSGGFSRVYKVEDTHRDNKIYALKILFIEIGQEGTEEQIETFNKEVSYLKRLHHNSIVRIEEELVIDNHPAILMELVEGISLQELLEKEKVLPAKEVMDIALQISAALLACHTYQIPREKLGLVNETILFDKYAIIHNDISSKNIIKEKDSEGNVNYKLIDFGLSYISGEKKETENILPAGTLEYYSPEKWEGKKIDTSSDIYSFGVVLFEMMAGEPPFPIANYADMQQVSLAKKHHLESNIPDLWEKRKSKLEEKGEPIPQTPDYLYWFQLLINKCLEKNPKDRFRTGEELNRYFQEGRRGKLESEWPNQINHQEEDDWFIAYSNNTIEGYEKFKAKYPASKHIVEANNEIDYLKDIERKKGLEKIDWQKAKQADDEDSYSIFIAKYPNSQFIIQAKEKMTFLKKLNSDYNDAKSKNTKKAYQQFLEKYPNSKYTEEVTHLIEQLNESDFIAKNKVTIAGIFAVIIVVIAYFYFSNRTIENESIEESQQTEYTEQANTTDLSNEEIIDRYYNALYVTQDTNKLYDNLLNFPIKYNGQHYDKTSFETIVNGILEKQKTDNLIKREVELKEVSKQENSETYKVQGTYSFLKKSKGKRPIKRVFNIKESLKIQDGKIIEINSL